MWEPREEGGTDLDLAQCLCTPSSGHSQSLGEESKLDYTLCQLIPNHWQLNCIFFPTFLIWIDLSGIDYVTQSTGGKSGGRSTHLRAQKQPDDKIKHRGCNSKGNHNGLSGMMHFISYHRSGTEINTAHSHNRIIKTG